MFDITIVSIAVTLTFFILVIESVRRKKLEVRYSLLWIFTCVILIILSISRGLLENIASFFRIEYAPSILFLFGLIFSLLMLFDLTRIISKLNHRVVNLTQEHALLKERVIEMEKELSRKKD